MTNLPRRIIAGKIDRVIKGGKSALVMGISISVLISL